MILRSLGERGRANIMSMLFYSDQIFHADPDFSSSGDTTIGSREAPSHAKSRSTAMVHRFPTYMGRQSGSADGRAVPRVMVLCKPISVTTIN